MNMNLKKGPLFLVLFLCLVIWLPVNTWGFDFQSLQDRLGPRDAVVVSGPDNRILFSHNADALLIPASTLKILTALTAFYYLGEDYRFRTEFYLDAQSNLKIKGRGDPLLISEVIADISTLLYQQLKDRGRSLANIIVDPSYFDDTVVIPGVTDSIEPYDSPNGSLCVNFNTVNFKTRNNRYISAEPQTPLLPMTIGRIKKTGLPRGRIMLSHQKDELAFYAGHLFKYFLEQTGVSISGKVSMGRVNPSDRQVLRYESPYTLRQVIKKMMTFSNNFMANQILIQAGIAQAGPPGTLSNGVTAAREYAKNTLFMDGLQIAEGSGISRKNRITATNLHKILLTFKPHFKLLRQEGTDFYKTGTLKDISTRVGFMGQDNASLYAYVILCNTPGKSALPIRNKLMRLVSP
jgi:serine-type D-Ala-D-Ala carboxypeptidase/endopeptidase (penicillin-binding protein 4)